MEQLIRQSDIIPIGVLGEPITIVGAGAVGSWTSLSLAKMGFGNIQVIDFDIVSIENMNSQFYRMKDIGKFKVHALQELVHEFTGFQIQANTEAYVQSKFNGIVIAAVDSMKVRQALFDAHQGVHPCFVIDPRMGAEVLTLNTYQPIQPDQRNSYEKTLFSDENSVQEPCTRKSTAYCASVLAGLVCAQVKAKVTNQPVAKSIQLDIPKLGWLSW